MTYCKPWNTIEETQKIGLHTTKPRHHEWCCKWYWVTANDWENRFGLVKKLGYGWQDFCKTYDCDFSLSKIFQNIATYNNSECQSPVDHQLQMKVGSWRRQGRRKTECQLVFQSTFSTVYTYLVLRTVQQNGMNKVVGSSTHWRLWIIWLAACWWGMSTLKSYGKCSHASKEEQHYCQVKLRQAAVIGLSPPFAYCAIFSVISSDVIDLHIAYILAALPLQSCAAQCRHIYLFDELTKFTGHADPFHLYTTVRPDVTWSICCFENDRANNSLSRQTMLSEDRQCCESQRDAELRDRAVCAVRDCLETHGAESFVLLCFSPHRDTAISCLTNDTLTTSSSSTDCYDDWRQASPTVRRPSYDVSSMFRHCHLLRRYDDVTIWTSCQTLIKLLRWYSSRSVATFPLLLVCLCLN